MAFLTTNPSPYLINIPEFQNVITNATGAANTLQTNVASLLDYVDTQNSAININTLSATTGTSITINNNLNLSNSQIYYNNSNLLSSNAINGQASLAFQTNSTEIARVTPSGLGIFNNAPAYPLSVTGNAVINGAIYISSFTAAPIAPLGNLYADGDIYARGVFYPSDPTLKKDISPYISVGLPEPKQFTWKSSGLRDIGVMADEVAMIEPVCVQSTQTGRLTVDYAKLVVLCLAELRRLSAEVKELQGRVP